MRHLLGILYNNSTMMPQNLITTIGNTVNECERSKQNERQENRQAGTEQYTGSCGVGPPCLMGH